MIFFVSRISLPKGSDFMRSDGSVVIDVNLEVAPAEKSLKKLEYEVAGTFYN